MTTPQRYKVFPDSYGGTKNVPSDDGEYVLFDDLPCSAPEPGGKQAAFDAEFATAIVDAAVPHAELDVYTSNSYRRVGLKGDYREVLYACKQNDGHLDIKNTPLLQAMVIAFNAMLARQPPETLSPPERSSPTKPEPDKKRPRTSFERFVDSLPPTKVAEQTEYCDWRWIDSGQYTRACCNHFAALLPRAGDKCPDCKKPIRMLKDNEQPENGPGVQR